MSAAFIHYFHHIPFNITMNFCLPTFVPMLGLLVVLSSCFVLSLEIKYYPVERDALLQLRDSMISPANLHRLWTGPPCFNNESRWAGVACSGGHVVCLVLEGILLTGSLPPSFLQNLAFLTKVSFRNNSIHGNLPSLTNLTHLEFVFLSYNRFSGSIPFEYVQLPNLEKLELQDNYIDGNIPPFAQPTLVAFNVSYNHLEGPIPKTSVLQGFPKSSYDYNSNLCGSPSENPCPPPPPPPPPPPIIVVPPSPLPSPPQSINKKRLQVWSVVLIAVAAAVVPFLVILVFLCYYKKMPEKEASKRQQSGEASEDKKMPSFLSTVDPERGVDLEFFDKNIPVFDLDDLLRASAEVLGKGKLGTTYKATLESGAAVVVKRLTNMSFRLTKKEFIQQMHLLGKMRHENLVQIISFYYSKKEKLVIYEFVPNGNLFELLHENREAGRVPLNWASRLSIIKEIAKGLAFLHQSLASHKVPHAHLKSSNVIINRHDQSVHSKLTNFGFLPLLPSRKSSDILAVGRSPEFCQGKKLTPKADVYCFGIILLEVITGRIPGEIYPGNDERTGDLSDWFRTAVINDWSTDILDVEILAAKEDHDKMLKLAEIALECTDMAPEKRPNMSQVLRRIEEIEGRN
ncbi:probable leucine-rich repeat receptor-like protein kinase At1g68400 [Tripterygium wilfordii]|uniref:probable leucine-rich repeat receptor-like protein kinase At1g68400 n=1 Tax=Tripterygium wilfordii TaxID=458696 RepID=UPI0018F7F1D3|nr:probable leucine-rich repeat receptor-like protein kinase At1g68400 [Tripterygium wilfordii]